jgi:hypothetical protein
MKLTDNQLRALKLASAGFAYYSAKQRFLTEGFKWVLDPYLPMKAEQAGQLAYFKALGYECRPIGEKTIKPGTFFLSCNTIDADKEKLVSLLNMRHGFIRADS